MNKIEITDEQFYGFLKNIATEQLKIKVIDNKNSKIKKSWVNNFLGDKLVRN